MLVGTVIVTSTSPNGAQPGCCFTFSPWCDNMAIIEGGFAMDELLEEIKKSGFYTYFVDHTTGIYPVAASGFPYSASQMQSKGDVITDLHEDLAAAE